MYSYDMATINSVLPAFANAKDVIICDEVASSCPLEAVQCCTDSSGPLAVTGLCTQASCLQACMVQYCGSRQSVHKCMPAEGFFCMHICSTPAEMLEAEPGRYLTATPPTLSG